MNTKIDKLDQAIKTARIKAEAATKALKELEDKKKVLMATEIGDVLRDFSIKPQDLRVLLESIKHGGAELPSAESGNAAAVSEAAGAAEEDEVYIPEPIVYEGVDYEK